MKLVMKARVTALVSARRNASSSVDKVYRRARKTTIATEDQALNALCDARLKERRHPVGALITEAIRVYLARPTVPGASSLRLLRPEPYPPGSEHLSMEIDQIVYGNQR